MTALSVRLSPKPPVKNSRAMGPRRALTDSVDLHDRSYPAEDGKVVDRIAITGRGFGK